MPPFPQNQTPRVQNKLWSRRGFLGVLAVVPLLCARYSNPVRAAVALPDKLPPLTPPDIAPAGAAAAPRCIRVETGLASWYGKRVRGHHTANGETVKPDHMTAAHRTWPMNSHVRVVHLHTDRSVIVRINDRGPFRSGRIIDLSPAAASALRIKNRGVAPVRLELLDKRAC